VCSTCVAGTPSLETGPSFFVWVDTSTGELLVLDGIIRPVVSTSALT